MGEREKIADTTIRIVEYPEPINEDADVLVGKQSTEIVMQKLSPKSSEDEGLSPAMLVSDGSLPPKEVIPVLPHSDVHTFLRIIKETDNEYREKEKQIIDEIERKRKEENIKQMEKELKKQKRDQEKLRKENEKAQVKREKKKKRGLFKKKKKKKKK